MTLAIFVGERLAAGGRAAPDLDLGIGTDL